MPQISEKDLEGSDTSKWVISDSGNLTELICKIRSGHPGAVIPEFRMYEEGLREG